MKYLFLHLSILLLSMTQLSAQKWGNYIPMGDLTSGGGSTEILFDLNNHVIFNSYGYQCYIDIETKELSKVIKTIPYNGEDYCTLGYSNSSMAFSKKSYIVTKIDTLIYVSEDTTIIYSENEIPALKTGNGFVAYNDDKYYIVHGLNGFFQGMHILDDNSLKLTHIEPEKLLNCYPSIGSGVKSYEIYNNKLYYYSWNSKLIEYEISSGEADSVDFSNYHKTLDFFYYASSPYIKNNMLICNSTRDFQYYTYNFDTKELFHDDLKNTIIREDFEGFFDDYDSLNPAYNILFRVRSDNKGGLLALAQTAQPEKYLAKLYFKPADGNWKRIPFPDSTYITKYFQVDKNNIWWFYSHIKEEYWEDGKSIFAAIPLDPYDQTSLEETEGMPTIIPLTVRPNPAITYTEVRFYLNPHAMSNVSFKIYDYMGKEIKVLDNQFNYDKQTAFAAKQIDVTGIKRGVYYLVVDNDVEKRAIGFVVE